MGFKYNKITIDIMVFYFEWFCKIMNDQKEGKWLWEIFPIKDFTFLVKRSYLFYQNRIWQRTMFRQIVTFWYKTFIRRVTSLSTLKMISMKLVKNCIQKSGRLSTPQPTGKVYRCSSSALEIISQKRKISNQWQVTRTPI